MGGQDLNPRQSNSKDQTFNHTNIVTFPDPYLEHEVVYLPPAQR